MERQKSEKTKLYTLFSLSRDTRSSFSLILAAHSLCSFFIALNSFFIFFWHCHGEVSIPFILLYFFALSSCAPLYILYEATVETRKTSFASRATFLSQFLALFHAIPAMERRAVQYTIASSTSQHQIGETRSCFPRTARLFGLDVLRKSKAHTHSQRGACTKVRCTVGSCWHLLHLKNNGLIK